MPALSGVGVPIGFNWRVSFVYGVGLMRTWIKVEGRVVSHPKTLHLAELWGCDPLTVVGFLVSFWDYLLEYQSDGQASGVRPSQLEKLAASCQQRALAVHLTVLDALKESGFVDPDGRVHDWEDYAGALVTRRQRDRDRKRGGRTVSAGNGVDTRALSAPRVEQSRVEVENNIITSSIGIPTDLLAWLPEGYHADLTARLRASHSPAGLIAEIRILRQEPELRGLKNVTGEHVGQALRDAAMKGLKLSGKTLANCVRVAQQEPPSAFESGNGAPGATLPPRRGRGPGLGDRMAAHRKALEADEARRQEEQG